MIELLENAHWGGESMNMEMRVITRLNNAKERKNKLNKGFIKNRNVPTVMTLDQKKREIKRESNSARHGEEVGYIKESENDSRMELSEGSIPYYGPHPMISIVIPDSLPCSFFSNPFAKRKKGLLKVREVSDVNSGIKDGLVEYKGVGKDAQVKANLQLPKETQVSPPLRNNLSINVGEVNSSRERETGLIRRFHVDVSHQFKHHVMSSTCYFRVIRMNSRFSW